MRTLKLYRHGATMGTPPQKNDHLRAKRGIVEGWSETAARRNTAFLRSVDESRLPFTEPDPDGYADQLDAHALTLTLRDCPPTPDEWHRLRRAFMDRLRREGLYRSHWVTEWQRRGVPHLHGAFWFPTGYSIARAIHHWVELTAPYGSQLRGQHGLAITDAVGWFKYLSKHASRGASHYQRNPENIPAEWKLRTGRVWGHTGPWPTTDPVAFSLDDQAYYRLRRLIRAWRRADVRIETPQKIRLMLRKTPEMAATPYWVQFRVSGAGRRKTAARAFLKRSERKIADVAGVSEWVPQPTLLLMLDHLRSEGHEIEC